jgi:TRAP-type transport system periplasmic protein
LNKFNEVQKYLTLTAHNYDAAVFIMSKTTYDTLPKDLQKVITKASKEAIQYERKVALEDEKQLLEDLRKTDIQIEENPDLDSFREAVKPVYKEFEGSIGKDLLEKIESLK